MAYPRNGCESAGHWLRTGMAGIGRGVRSAFAHIPSNCPLCSGKAFGGQLCPACRGDVLRSMRGPARRCGVCRLALAADGACPDCSRRVPAFQRVVAAFDYAMPGDLLINQLKAGRRFSHAPFLAGLLAQAVEYEGVSLPGNTILVPVPASRASIVRRGFNPAAELARYLAPRLSLRSQPRLLVREREGERQTHLGREQRLSQDPHLYRCTARVDGLTIAVVDDVLTTGGTLHGIARRFRQAGALAVWGLVLARTPYR